MLMLDTERNQRANGKLALWGTHGSDSEGWPKLASDALYGLAGEIVRAIEPHTEADPVGLLIQLQVCFGNVIGREAHRVADGAPHYANLFVCLVGDTSKARKGTSWAQVRKLFQEVNPDWARNNIQSGLSSGEGLIHGVRDPTIDKEGEITDQGIEDKRLLVFEAEFASALKVMNREGNTLSPIMRECWDTGNLQSLQRNSPLSATDAHVSIVGHITQEELQRLLNATEASNGLANRFLWVCVKRSNILPEGGSPAPESLSPLIHRLKKAVVHGEGVKQIGWDAEARKLWYEVYPALSEGKKGMLGAITSRSEAQVLRLACIYALLDCSPIIHSPHLKAALALWQYCEDSARFLFSQKTGNPVADQILAALENAPQGLTLTEIQNRVFQRHGKSEAIRAALASLAALGRAYMKQEATNGRTREVWFLGPNPCN